MKHLIWIIFIGLMIVSCSRHDDTADIIYTQARSVDKLHLGQMTVSKMATIDDLKLSEAEGLKQTASALIDQLKIGARKGAYSYDTYLTAYIDLGELRQSDIALDPETRRAIINLPAIHTEWTGRDPEVREIHYRVTGLRSHIDATERARLKETMNTALKAEIESNPRYEEMLVGAARDKARKYFETLFASNGYTVDVRFK